MRAARDAKTNAEGALSNALTSTVSCGHVRSDYHAHEFDINNKTMATTDSRVTTHMAASLDCFIGRKDGNVNWRETSVTFASGDEMLIGGGIQFFEKLDQDVPLHLAEDKAYEIGPIRGTCRARHHSREFRERCPPWELREMNDASGARLPSGMVSKKDRLSGH